MRVKGGTRGCHLQQLASKLSIGNDWPGILVPLQVLLQICAKYGFSISQKKKKKAGLFQFSPDITRSQDMDFQRLYQTLTHGL